MPARSTTTSNAGLLAGVPVASFWLDESGSKATAARCFVVAGIKTRHSDDLQRALLAVREQTGFDNEFKFGRITARNYDAAVKIVDVLEQSDARIVATVIDATYNPFRGREIWQAHAEVITQLIVGNINRNEVANAFLDGISTPAGKSLGSAVRRSVNNRLNGSPLVNAVSLNSKTNDLLQVADLVAGAIRYDRLAGAGSTSEEKRRIVRRLAAAFDVSSFGDQRTGRVNISLMRGRAARNSTRSGRAAHLKAL